MRAELKDSLENLFHDSKTPLKPVTTLQVDVARGGTIAAHLLVNGLKAGDAVKLKAEVKSGSAGKPSWFQLIDVPVEENTGLGAFVESPDNPNPHVVRRAPFRTYDAIKPIKTTVKAVSETMAFRVEIPVASDAKPGKVSCGLEIGSGKETQLLQLEAVVHKAVIPPVGKASFPYTNWFNIENIASRHGLKEWTPSYWSMLKKYAEIMFHARQNVFWVIPGTVFHQTKKGLTLDRERLRKYVKLFTDAGLFYIEGGHIAGRTGGDWNAKTFTAIGGATTSSKEGYYNLAAAASQLMEEIEANGWRSRWIQHVADEPIDTLATEYRIATGIMHKLMPGIPILDATMNLDLLGSVNYWCPQVQEYQNHRDEFEAARKTGDQVWFYTCCSPGGPWLNRLLDQELLRPALYGWAAARYELDGFLHWGFNMYRHDQNPFEQSVVEHGGNNKLPAGDTHIVYPGDDGPWSSARLEAQREGTEDYELLMMLKAKDKKIGDRVVRKALRSFDDYTKDMKTYRAAKKALLDALDG